MSSNEGLVSLVRGPAHEKESTSLKFRLWDVDGVWPDSRCNYKTRISCRPEGRRGSSLPAVQSQHHELPDAQIQLRGWAPCQVPFSHRPFEIPHFQQRPVGTSRLAHCVGVSCSGWSTGFCWDPGWQVRLQSYCTMLEVTWQKFMMSRAGATLKPCSCSFWTDSGDSRDPGMTLRW